VKRHPAVSRQDSPRRHAVGRMSFEVSFQLFFRSAQSGKRPVQLELPMQAISLTSGLQALHHAHLLMQQRQ
jgi:hypothetical protein